MIVPSIEFFIFAGIGAVLFNLSNNSTAQRVIFLTLSAVFLASYSSDPIAFGPIAGFIGVGYLVQRYINPDVRSGIFVASIVFIIALFAWLKRYAIFPSSAFLNFPYIELGMSYLFFRILHVTIDRRQGVMAQPAGLISYVSYLLNFTAIVSGPIQRYEDYREAEIRPLPLNPTIIGESAARIVLGCFKVMAVSTVLQMLREHYLVNLSPEPDLLSRAVSAALVIALYALFLYFNFSGYTDVVIGVARFFRKPLPENFDRPFSSTNFISFWSRWHITLSVWLKTYVYNPLLIALMQRYPSASAAPFLAVVAFFVTFSLVGIWHGQTSEFLLFGILQGGGVAVNKLYQVEMTRRLGRNRYRQLSADPIYIILCRGLTFTYFAWTLLWFALDWKTINKLFAATGAGGFALAIFSIWLVASIFFAGWEAVRNKLLAPPPGSVQKYRFELIASRYFQTVWITGIAFVTVVVLIVLNSPTPELVYKAF